MLNLRRIHNETNKEFFEDLILILNFQKLFNGSRSSEVLQKNIFAVCLKITMRVQLIAREIF